MWHFVWSISVVQSYRYWLTCTACASASHVLLLLSSAAATVGCLCVVVSAGPRPLAEGNESFHGAQLASQHSIRHPPEAGPSSSDEEEDLDEPVAASNGGARAVAEGVEPPQLAGDAEQAAMAAAWNAARATGHGGSNSGWGGGSRPGGIVSSAGIAFGTSASGAPNAAARAATRQHVSLQGGAASQHTWTTAGSRAAAALGLRQQRHQNADPAAAAARFLDRFWFMVDDLVGDDKQVAMQRVRLPVLVFYVVSTLQRCLTALFFGLYHFSYISTTQLSVLLALHTAFFLYLILVRPYVSVLMLAADLLAYGCELSILAAALLLRQQPGNPQLLQLLVACYFIDVTFMLLPDLLRYCVMAYQWLQHRKRQKQQQAGGQSQAGTAAGGVAADGSVFVSHNVGKGRKGRQQQQAAGVIAGPRASDMTSAAAASDAAAAALQLTDARE